MYSFSVFVCHVFSFIHAVANVIVQLHGESARVNDIGRVAEETTHDDVEKGEAPNVPALLEPIICTSIPTAALAEHVAQVTQTETRFKTEYEVKYFIEWRQNCIFFIIRTEQKTNGSFTS